MSYNKSRLELIIGPMFASKTTELKARTDRYKHRKSNNRVLLISHESDKRPSPIDGSPNENSIQTHTGERRNAIKTSRLMLTLDAVKQHDVIGIDEAQFFDDLYDFFIEIEPLGKVVIIAGLDGDFQRKPFGQILQLIPLCDNVTKLTAMAEDGTDAIFSKRIVESKEQKLVGASETYKAVSRAEYFA